MSAPVPEGGVGSGRGRKPRVNTIPPNNEAWAEQFLSYIGAPASGPQDPRVLYLEGWTAVEATFGDGTQEFPHGNTFNPLDVEYTNPPYGDAPLFGQGPDWNSQGVSTFYNADAGNQALVNFWSNPTDEPTLKVFEDQGATMSDIITAVGEGAWVGNASQVGPQANPNYAKEIANAAGTIVQTPGGGTPGYTVPPSNTGFGDPGFSTQVGAVVTAPIHAAENIGKGLGSLLNASTWETIGLTVVGVLAGLGIVALGAYEATKPAREQAQGKAAEAAPLLAAA